MAEPHQRRTTDCGARGNSPPPWTDLSFAASESCSPDPHRQQHEAHPARIPLPAATTRRRTAKPTDSAWRYAICPRACMRHGQLPSLFVRSVLRGVWYRMVYSRVLWRGVSSHRHSVRRFFSARCGLPTGDGSDPAEHFDQPIAHGATRFTRRGSRQDPRPVGARPSAHSLSSPHKMTALLSPCPSGRHSPRPLLPRSARRRR